MQISQRQSNRSKFWIQFMLNSTKRSEALIQSKEKEWKLVKEQVKLEIMVGEVYNYNRVFFMFFIHCFLLYFYQTYPMSNPFSLQTDNKKFFTGLSGSSLDIIYESEATKEYANRIKNMNNELEQLARKRQQMLFKESQMDYIFKRQKPSVGLGDFITAVPKNDKKFRVRALLKQKKQSLHDFLNKKKEIYLSKMNINIKKEQTSKLADSIRDEQETLKARQLYFENDIQFMHKFIDGIKKQAEQAQNAVEAELKQQQMLVSKENALTADIQKIDNLISKDLQILDSLQQYKKFIEYLYEQKGNPNWKPYSPQAKQQKVSFITEGGAALPHELKEEGLGFVINYEPANMIQIFNNSQQANIRQVHKLQDKQDELETVTMQEREEETELQQIINESQQRISVLEKTCTRKLQECQRMRQLKKANNNKINILDNENLDIEKVRVRVFNIYEQINPKRAQQVEQIKSQAEIKRQMAQIQSDIEKMRSQINQQKQMYPHLIPQIERNIKTKQKQQNIQKKQEENKRLELKKQQEQQKKRSQAHNQKPKGRKDMQKVMLKKKQKVQKKHQSDNEDHDEQYFEQN